MRMVSARYIAVLRGLIIQFEVALVDGRRGSHLQIVNIFHIYAPLFPFKSFMYLFFRNPNHSLNKPLPQFLLKVFHDRMIFKCICLLFHFGRYVILAFGLVLKSTFRVRILVLCILSNIRSGNPVDLHINNFHDLYELLVG